MIDSYKPPEDPNDEEYHKRIQRFCTVSTLMIASFFAGSISNTLQPRIMHPDGYKDYQPIEEIDGINDMSIVRRDGRMFLYAGGGEFDMTDFGVEVRIEFPWNILHVKVGEKGELLGKTEPYQLANGK